MVPFSTAKELLGASPVYTPEDVESVFGVTYSSEQRDALASIPFSEETLRACAGTHVLFPGYGLSLLDIRERHSNLFFAKTGGWFGQEQHAFSRVPVPVRWHLLRMEPVPESFLKSWQEQQTLLLPDEEVPSAATVTFATMLHFKVTGVRLFKSSYVRTSDVDADGFRVFVGLFVDDGFDVYSVWDDRRAVLGLASARRSS